MYSASTLNGIGGWTPYLKIRYATIRTATAWRNLPRGWAIASGLRRGRRRGGGRGRGPGGRRGTAPLEGHQEGDQVDVLLGREHLPERRRHDPGREPRDGALGFRVEDLPHDVVDGLGAPDVGQVGT